jgi:hypothetical protein
MRAYSANICPFEKRHGKAGKLTKSLILNTVLTFSPFANLPSLPAYYSGFL